MKNGVTIINAIGQEGRYYVSKIEENKSILCSVVSYTDNSNVEILSTLLQNINVEQSKLDPESKLYILYQQLKDDEFCTAVAENNSVAATVLIQNNQEKIAPRESVVNNNGILVVTTNQVVTTLSVESNGNVGNKLAPFTSTKEINSDKTAMPSDDNKLMASQILNFLHKIRKKLNIKKARRIFTLH